MSILNTLQGEIHTFTNANLQGGVTLTQAVNSGDNLVLGSCCAAKIEFSLLDLDLSISGLTGEEFEYRCNGILKGYFTAEKPEKINDSGWKVACYDRMVKFDQPINEWLEDLSYPITLKDMLTSLCSYMGVELATPEFTNDDFPVQNNFSGKDIKGRDFLYWIAEAAGCFARINAEGALELGFYTESGKTVDRSSYQSNTLSDYATKPIDKLQIRQNEDDIGVIAGTGSNCYSITGNPLFFTDSSEALQPAAEALLGKLEGFSYTPFEAALIDNGNAPEPGEVITITTRLENNVKSIVMEKRTAGIQISISSKGDYEQTELKSVNKTIQVQNGKTNELERTLEQTVLRLTDTYNKAETNSVIEQTASSIRTEFSKIGGDNLIHNGGFIHDKTSWSFSEDAVYSIHSDSMTTSKKTLTLESGEVSLAEPIQVTPGTPYAIYFKYKASYLSNGSASLFIGTKEIPLPESDTYKETGASGAENDPYVFTFGSDPVAIRIAAENADFSISDLTMIEGTVCSAFCMAPGESRTASVSISDDGIQIERTGGQFKGTYTDSEVHYVKQTDNSTVARFSADGAETGMLTVTGAATVQRSKNASHAFRIIPASDHVKFVIND